MKLRHLMIVTVPACLAAGWSASRAVGDVQSRNAQAVLATFKAAGEQSVEFPAPGDYWVFAAGTQDDIKVAGQWVVSAQREGNGALAMIRRPDTRRSQGRENRSALDMLFIVRVGEPGRYTLRLSDSSRVPAPLSMRITRYSAANAGAAMRAFGLAALFSLLLVGNAILWFRGAPSR